VSVVSVTYSNGKVREFDVLANPDRRTLAVSLMTVAEMVRFFTGAEAAEMAKQLGLPATGKAETAVCQSIHNFFHLK
jgi:hypothetical protein